MNNICFPFKQSLTSEHSIFILHLDLTLNYFYKELRKYLCNSRRLWTWSVHCPSTAITINGLKYPTRTKVGNATFDIMTEIKSSLPFSCPGVWNFNSQIQTPRRHYFLIESGLRADPWPLIGQRSLFCPLIGWASLPLWPLSPPPLEVLVGGHTTFARRWHIAGARIKMYFV